MNDGVTNANGKKIYQFSLYSLLLAFFCSHYLVCWISKDDSTKPCPAGFLSQMQGMTKNNGAFLWLQYFINFQHGIICVICQIFFATTHNVPISLHVDVYYFLC